MIPVTTFALGVHVQCADVVTGVAAHDEHIRPAVARKIVSQGDHVVLGIVEGGVIREGFVNFVDFR